MYSNYTDPMDVQLLEKGKVEKFLSCVRQTPDILGTSFDFQKETPVLDYMWRHYPQVTRRILRELFSSESSEKMTRLLEAISIKFTFQWEDRDCEVVGNFLFMAVWNGEYDLVSELIQWGMDPDGVSRSCYTTERGNVIEPYSRWGVMRCISREDIFFNQWYMNWRFERPKDIYLITPLYLAELLEDDRMIQILKDAGACEMPSREKMWEESISPKNNGSVFGNL